MPALSEPISIIIPTLNEAANIAHLLIRLHQALTDAMIPYEAIIVDDHSTDNTISVAHAVARDNYLPVRILTKKGQPGKSYSLMEGFASAQFNVLAMIDGDLQYPPEALPIMAQEIGHADIIVADRRTTYLAADQTRGRMSHIFTSIIGMLFNIDTDMQSGLKVFRREIYDKGVKSCSGCWNLDLYLVTHAIFHGYALSNVPIEFHERQSGESKVIPLKVGMELLRTALQLKIKRVADIIAKRYIFRNKREALHHENEYALNHFITDAVETTAHTTTSDIFKQVMTSNLGQ
jgi:dolichol-phosphate mannosyltransferase